MKILSSFPHPHYYSKPDFHSSAKRYFEECSNCLVPTVKVNGVQNNIVQQKMSYMFKMSVSKSF